MKEFNNTLRVKITFKGIVQGVGFRPYIYKCAHKFGITGYVKNSSQGVIIEAEGGKIEEFLHYIQHHLPPLSKVDSYNVSYIPLQNSIKFEILSSDDNQETGLLIPPDIAICQNCKNELFLYTDRRFQYPFINCTDCGPRFTIIKNLPYDRPKTTMKKFDMCPSCKKEYSDPMDRRYHAQPVSCYQCGPSLSLTDMNRKEIKENPISAVCQKLKEGFIVSIKGLGGFHLSCLTSNEESIKRLRELKNRNKKPFALMGTMEMIDEHTVVSGTEKELLLSSASPIILLKKKNTSNLSHLIAPDQDTIGFMLPYTPIHLLLLENIGEPLIMTSANISDEPIIYQDHHPSLGALSDYILSNDREIQTFADDSVAQVFGNQPYMVRRSRGYVPVPINVPFHSSKTILGLGPMLKTTFSFFYEKNIYMSQYIGNTDSPLAIEAEKSAIRHFMNLFSLKPDIIAIDQHPGYPNRQIAEDFTDVKIVGVQHHKAHVGSLLAENGEKGKIIGISLDGTGFGEDGNIWGGEFFVGNYKGLTRFGHLKNLFLPSGDRSIKEPWRFALSALHSLYGISEKVLRFAGRFGKKGEGLLEVIDKRIGGVMTSSCGRLFDAVASIMGIGDYSSYEGDLPIRLQTYAEQSNKKGTFNYSIQKEKNNQILNLLPTIHDIIEDKSNLADKARIFHWTLAKGLVEMAEFARDEYNINKVGLTGGVFQNTLLLQMTKDLLEERKFKVLLHSEIPPNDGGISAGQVLLAFGKLNKEM
jgi:hydrogenase maturation protein HypF